MTKRNRIQNHQRRLQSSAINNPASIQMRQNSELYRQTLVRYAPDEISNLLIEEEKHGGLPNSFGSAAGH